MLLQTYCALTLFFEISISVMAIIAPPPLWFFVQLIRATNFPPNVNFATDPTFSDTTLGTTNFIDLKVSYLIRPFLSVVTSGISPPTTY